MENEQERPTGCLAGCKKCILWLFQADSEGPKGARLVLLAAAAFISPLIQAIVGAMVLPLVWHYPASRTVGALAGLALGLVDSCFVVWIITRSGKKQA